MSAGNVIDFTHRDGALIGKLAKRVRLVDFAALRDELIAQTEAEHCQTLILDMDEVELMDSNVIGLVVSSLRRLNAQGKKMALANLTPSAVESLRVTNLLSIIPHHATVSDALEATGH